MSILPYYRLHLFDPGRPIYYDLGLRASGNYQFKPGLLVSGTLEQAVFTTFDDIWRGEKGNLPKVRTGLKNYLNETDLRVDSLVGLSFFKLSDDIYGRISQVTWKKCMQYII